MPTNSTPDPIRALIEQWQRYAADAATAASLHRKQGQEMSKQFHLGKHEAFLRAVDELKATLLTAPPEASWCPNGVWHPEGKITFNAVLSKADADQLCAAAPPTEPTT